VLRILESPPTNEVRRNREVRDCPVVAASLTESLWAISRNQPVADIELGVAAEAISGFGLTQWTPKVALWIKSL
jgi:hypothetical protein